MKNSLLIIGIIFLINSGYALTTCLGTDRSFTSMCSDISSGSCLAHEYYTTVGFINYPCEWTGTVCGVYSSQCSTTTTPISTSPGTTSYPYSLPNTNYGTLPGLNGTGGITINNGTIKNMTCTGWCIIGLKKEEFTLYAAIMISLLVLFAVKPFKLGATASFVAVAFFNNIVGWTVVTTSVMLIYAIVAFGAWFVEGKE
ncbi:MAG: hypothetical protein IMZ64_13050 [Bacteroidetes bacterium]|nr:hypothetical protein [Bacteroidota bacterium]